jgi:hypothetical protein
MSTLILPDITSKFRRVIINEYVNFKWKKQFHLKWACKLIIYLLTKIYMPVSRIFIYRHVIEIWRNLSLISLLHVLQNQNTQNNIYLYISKTYSHAQFRDTKIGVCCLSYQLILGIYCLVITGRRKLNICGFATAPTALRPLMNQHQLDTLFLVWLLRVTASTYFRRHSPIFWRLCKLLFGITVCVGCVLVACRLRWCFTATCTQSMHILRTKLRQIATVQSLLKMGESRPKHVEAVTLNKQTKKRVSSWCWFIIVPWCTVNNTSRITSVINFVKNVP